MSYPLQADWRQLVVTAVSDRQAVHRDAGVTSRPSTVAPRSVSVTVHLINALQPNPKAQGVFRHASEQVCMLNQPDAVLSLSFSKGRSALPQRMTSPATTSAPPAEQQSIYTPVSYRPLNSRFNRRSQQHTECCQTPTCNHQSSKHRLLSSPLQRPAWVWSFSLLVHS